MTFHLAQVNIARMRGSPADPVMNGLVSRIEEMNRLAERLRSVQERGGTEFGFTFRQTFPQPASDSRSLSHQERNSA